jgi:hypothetical protein
VIRVYDDAGNVIETHEHGGDFKEHPAISPISIAVFAAPKRIGLRSHIRLSGVLIEFSSITLPDVSTHLRPGLKNRLGGLTFAGKPLSAISRFNRSPESPEARPLLKASREDGSSFRADLGAVNPNERSFMKFVSLTKPMAVSPQIQTYTELLQQIHRDLRIQHPEWVQPNGESPMCDSYEARLMELLDPLTRTESNASLV